MTEIWESFSHLRNAYALRQYCGQSSHGVRKVLILFQVKECVNGVSRSGSW